MSTNVTPDARAEMNILLTILREIDKHLQITKKTTDAKNAQIIANHLAGGGELSSKLVSSKYAALMKKKLEDNKIPYVMMPDNQGNFAFCVRNTDADIFQQIQHEVFSTSTEYFAQTSLEDMYEIAKSNEEEYMIKITLDNADDFNEVQRKLYAANIVCAVDKDTNTLYVNAGDTFNANGKDLTSFEMEWAMNQSLNDAMFRQGDGDSLMQKLRDAQSDYDLSAIKTFSKCVQNGESKTFFDSNNSSSTYLQCNAHGLFVMQNIEGEWKKNEAASKSREELKNMSHEEIGAFVSKYGFSIQNAFVMDSSELKQSNFFNLSVDAAGSFMKGKEWTDTSSKDANGNERKEPAYRGTRPTGPLDKASKEALKVKKNELEPLLEKIERNAKKRVAEMGKGSNVKKRELLKETICNMLRDTSSPEVAAFLNGGDNYETRLEWLKNIVNHYENEHEIGTREITIERVPLKTVKKTISEQKQVQKAAGKEAERTQNYEKEEE